MSVDWFRSWHGAPTDPKWRVVAKRANVRPIDVAGLAWALLDHASQAEDRGLVTGFDFETYAEQMGIEEAEARAIYAALEAKEIIVSGRIAKWEKRQPRREDASGERVTRHRRRDPELPLAPPAAEKVAPAAPISAQESDSAPPAAEESPAETESETDRAPLISPQAIKLADDIAVAAGHDLEFVPPAWCGAAARVQMWLDQGWSPPLIIESARAQMTRKRDGPPNSVKFFEKGIARAHASAADPLPQPEESIHATSRNTGGGFGRLARACDESVRRDPPRLRVVDGS